MISRSRSDHAGAPSVVAPPPARSEVRNGRFNETVPSTPEALATESWERLDFSETTYRSGGARLLDLVLSITLLPAVALLCLPLALVNAFVFRDPRKVFFQQRRTGRHGIAFTMFKFRTLCPGHEDNFAGWLAGQDRQRVTSFGRLLRASHLDELPQLVNILRGEMSFVGPRPEMVEIHDWAEERVSGFGRRLAVRPGLTGRAQLSRGYAGSEVQAYRDKLAADLRWMRSRSLRGDLAILTMTLTTVLGALGNPRKVRWEGAASPLEPAQD